MNQEMCRELQFWHTMTLTIDVFNWKLLAIDVETQNFCNNQPAMGMPCVSGTTGVAARSKHVGGVQVLMGDGAVRFVSNNINLPTWQGLSTMQGSETLGAY